MKTNDLHIRISDRDFNLIKSAADKLNMTVSHLILAVLIPYCLKQIE